MKIFVCEFITAGGWQEPQLPEALAREGETMLRALLHDLQDAGCRDLVCTRDRRLASLPAGIEIVTAGENAWDTWRSLMQECDATWIIAPETDEILYRLVRLAEECNCRVIGCSPEFIRVTTSKWKTAEWLQSHSIPTVPVYTDPRDLPDHTGGWVIKPDDGVGGEGVYYIRELSRVRAYCQRQADARRLLQPYIPGTAASMTLLCHAGNALLLGCNEQCFVFGSDGKGELQAVIVNGLRRYHDAMIAIADDLARAMPRETAFIGVDLIIAEEGPVVIEINPRLTTAYAGLHRSLGVNPAGLVLSLLQGGDLPDMRGFRYHPVRINI